MHHRFWTPLLAAVLFTASGCSFDPKIDTVGTITCQAEGECPQGLSCDLNAKRCVQIGGAVRSASVVDGSVQLSRAQAGLGIPVEVSFDVSDDLGAQPAVEIRAPASQPLELVSNNGHSYRFRYTPSAPATPGVWPILVTLTSASGLTTPDTLLANLVLDFSPPEVIASLSSSRVLPPAGSPLASPTQLASGATALLSLTLSEGLDQAPTLLAKSASASCGPFELVESVGANFTYRYQVPSDGSCPDGSYALHAQMADAAGNQVDQVLTFPFVVDTQPPPPLTAAQLASIRYLRVPWGHSVSFAAEAGEPCIDDTPCFSVRGAAGGADPNGFIGIWRGPDTATAELLALGGTDGSGAFWTQTIDAQAVYVAQIDAAGNVSDASAAPGNQAQLVSRESWVATLGGKIPGRTGENPHRISTLNSATIAGPVDARWLETTSPEQVAKADASSLAVSADRSGATPSWSSLFPSTPISPGTHDGPRGAWDPTRGVIHMFGGYHYNSDWDFEDWNGSGWANLTPIPRPATWPVVRDNPGLVYDPVRDRLVLFGGETRGNACPIGSNTFCADTWEYDGVSWQPITPTDILGDGNPAGRTEAALFFDQTLQKVVLFGGHQLDTRIPFLDMWTWDGVSWDKLTVAAPAADAIHFAYDTGRSVGVLFDGFTQETWEWNGSTWTETTAATIDTTNTPLDRRLGAMAFDSARGKIVLFGGVRNVRVGGGTQDVNLNDVWEYDDSTHAWTNRTPPSGALQATARNDHMMTYDPVRQRTVVFGGYLDSGEDDTTTWLWDGTRWTESGNAPAGLTLRSRHAGTFDLAQRKLVVFGGTDGSNLLADTWLFDGLDWSAGPTAPPALTARTDAALAYDPAHGGSVLVGGDDGAVRADTWLLDGTGWTASTDAPAPRRAAAIGYHAGTGKLVLFGGEDASGTAAAQTWLWDGSWSDASSGTAPPPRAHAAMAYDAVHDRLVLYGGTLSDGTVATDTWLFDGSSWQPAANGPGPRSHHTLAYDASRQRVVLSGGTDGTSNCDGSGTALCTASWEWDGAAWTPLATGPAPRLDAVAAYDPVRERVLVFGGDDGVAHNDLSENQAPAGSPQLLASFRWTVTNALAFDGLSLRGRAGGLAYDAAMAPAPGFDVRLWQAAAPVSWSVVSTDSVHSGIGSDLGSFAYSTTDAAAIGRVLSAGTASVQIGSEDQIGFGSATPSIDLDYVELRVDYQR